MNCITMLLKTSEVMAVRRAVLAALASRRFPLAQTRMGSISSGLVLGQTRFMVRCPHTDRCERQRIYYADDVVSAFLTTAHVGKIERIAQSFSKTKRIFLPILQAA